MRNILAKDLKIKFIETFKGLKKFSYEDGNPFLIMVNKKHYFIFLKNLSSAYFKKSPDITRVQLPYSDHFQNIFKTDIPFIILGYDVDNDIIVCWNYKRIKERLNSKNNVSLYSRESLQASVNSNEFKEAYLTNGEKIILFRRDYLITFFDNFRTLFIETKHSKNDINETITSEPEVLFHTKKLFEITDKDLLKIIIPLLKKNKVLDAVDRSTLFYKGEYIDMTFKDWFKLVNEQYQKINTKL